ncbi:MAG: hypothetical protein JW904_01400 [Spirochaetales bacterium]|nr:hypothetical protein [Spirochaetales bacterium]
MSAVFIPNKKNSQSGHHSAETGSWFETLDGTACFPEGMKTLLCCAGCGTGNIKIDITDDLILVVTCLECGQEMHYGD